MTEGRRRLLLVDGASGPAPEFYGPRLPPELDLRVVVTPAGSAAAWASRVRALRALAPVDVVDDPACLEEAVERVAREWRADGIAAFSERVVHLASAAARRVGLPANSEAAQRALYDKEAQRLAMVRGGVPCPAFRRVECAADLEPALRAVGLPAVLKPVTGMGSLAVFRVDSPEELRRAYDEGMVQYGRDSRVAGRRPSFLLERELIGQRWHPDPRVGDYVAVDSLVGGGRIAHAAMQDKLPLAHPYRETGHILPSTLPAGRRREVLEMTERCIRSLGVTVAAVQVEIKLTADGPRVLEVNGRCGGAIPNMTYAAGGYNQVAAIARLFVGGVAEGPAELPRFAAYLTPQAPAERVRIERSPGLERLLAIPGVIAVDSVAEVGSEPDWRSGTSANLARVEAAADTWEELVRMYEDLTGLWSWSVPEGEAG